MLQQEPHQVLVAKLAGDGQRRDAARQYAVRSGAVLQQSPRVRCVAARISVHAPPRHGAPALVDSVHGTRGARRGVGRGRGDAVLREKGLQIRDAAEQ